MSVDGQAPRPAGPRINVSTLTIDELEEIESKVGHTIAREIMTFDFRMDTIKGLLWIGMRRENPNATYEEAGKLDFDQLMGGIEGPEPEPPPPPGGQPGSSGPGEGPPTPTSSSSEPPNVASVPSSATGTA